MSRITVDGDEFEVKRLSRNRYNPTYILMVSLRNLNDVNIPRSERERILNCHSRRDLTNDVIEAELERFASKYPEAEIDGFGVTEEFPAREGELIPSPDS